MKSKDIVLAVIVGIALALLTPGCPADFGTDDSVLCVRAGGEWVVPAPVEHPRVGHCQARSVDGGAP